MRIKDSKHILIKLLARLWVSAGLITTFTSLAQAQTQVFNDIDVHKKVFQQTQTEKQIKAQTFSCTEIGHNSFFGCYYASKNLINLSAVKTEKELNFNWPDSPVAGVSPVFASAQFKGRFVFEAGIYEFNLTSTNKSYLFIDGASVLDASNTESSKTFAVTKNVKAGQHLIEIRYYRESKEAVLKLDWKKNWA